jgi:cytochrome bd-type quinol oxidase subunit 2
LDIRLAPPAAREDQVRLPSAEVAEKVPQRAADFGYERREIATRFDMLAFRHTAQRLRMQQLTGALFAAASLITPFFMGTVVGAVATGQVPVHPAGNVLAAWTSPTAILTGFLFVAACAYVSAVYLVIEAVHRRHRELTPYFTRRATAAGVVTGALAGGTFGELSVSSPYVFGRLTGIALPLVAVSIAAGITVIGMLWLRWYHPLGLRATAAIAVATVVFGWGLAQYPYLFPRSLSLASGSAPSAALVRFVRERVRRSPVLRQGRGAMSWGPCMQPQGAPLSGVTRIQAAS